MATLMNEVLKAKKMRTTTTFFFSQVRVYGHGFDLLHYLFLCLFVGLFVCLFVSLLDMTLTLHSTAQYTESTALPNYGLAQA